MFVTALTTIFAIAQAQDAIFRTDTKAGITAYTLGAEDKNGVGLYAFGYNTAFPEYDFGQVKKLWSHGPAYLYGGGYAAYWPGNNQGNAWFLQPWVIAGTSVGKVDFHLAVGGYAPLNGGPTVFFVNDASALYNVSKTVAGGFGSISWEQTQAQPSFQYGPKFRFSLGSGYGLSMAAYLWGNKDPKFRCILTKTF